LLKEQVRQNNRAINEKTKRTMILALLSWLSPI
jgi:hypothetical protein